MIATTAHRPALPRRPRRNRERGAALMITLIILASLLAGAAAVVSLQLGANRATDLTRSGMTAEYCAEAGVERASPIVAANYALWSSSMCGSANEASCLPASPAAEVALLAPPAINHDIDGDGIPDFVLYLRDDQDEPTGPQNYTVDRNARIFIVATCIKYPDTPRQVKVLVQAGGGSNNYAGQQGGEWSNTNFNGS
jgi:hypothetical protein